MDLDGDGAAEGLVCGAGKDRAGQCFVADTVGGIIRYHSLDMPWQDLGADAAPLVASWKDGTYLLWVGERSPGALLGSKASGATRRVMHFAYFDGGAFEVVTER